MFEANGRCPECEAYREHNHFCSRHPRHRKRLDEQLRSAADELAILWNENDLLQRRIWALEEAQRAGALETLQDLVDRGELMVYDPDTRCLKEAASICLNGKAVQVTGERWNVPVQDEPNYCEAVGGILAQLEDLSHDDAHTALLDALSTVRGWMEKKQ